MVVPAAMPVPERYCPTVSPVVLVTAKLVALVAAACAVVSDTEAWMIPKMVVPATMPVPERYCPVVRPVVLVTTKLVSLVAAS